MLVSNIPLSLITCLMAAFMWCWWHYLWCWGQISSLALINGLMDMFLCYICDVDDIISDVGVKYLFLLSSIVRLVCWREILSVRPITCHRRWFCVISWCWCQIFLLKQNHLSVGCGSVSYLWCWCQMIFPGLKHKFIVMFQKPNSDFCWN